MPVSCVTGESKYARQEMLRLLVGDLIGEGAHRRVYACAVDPSVVLKVERYEGEFANVREWQAWDELQWDPRAKPWLAPCLQIDRIGLVLMQRRCPDLTDAQWSRLGDVPSWLSDTRRENWGWYDDPDGSPRPVMRDYAINNLVRNGVGRSRKVKPQGKD